MVERKYRMPDHPYMLLTSLIGAHFVWTNLWSQKAVWFGHEFRRTEKPLPYWLSVAFGGCLIAAGLFYAWR